MTSHAHGRTDPLNNAPSFPPSAVYVNPWSEASQELPPELRQNPRRTSTLPFTRTGYPPQLVRQSELRVNFVDSLVDTATQIVAAIWPLSATAIRNPSPSDRQAHLPLRTFIQETLRRSRASYSTLQVALYYLILLKPHVASRDFTMEQPVGDCVYPALQDGRRMFLAALILASKYLQDRNFSARAWSRISGLDVAEINHNEISFLFAVEWKLHVAEDVFQRWADVVLKFSPPSMPPMPGGSSFCITPQAAAWRRFISELGPELDNLDCLISTMLSACHVRAYTSPFPMGLTCGRPEAPPFFATGFRQHDDGRRHQHPQHPQHPQYPQHLQYRPPPVMEPRFAAPRLPPLRGILAPTPGQLPAPWVGPNVLPPPPPPPLPYVASWPLVLPVPSAMGPHPQGPAYPGTLPAAPNGSVFAANPFYAVPRQPRPAPVSIFVPHHPVYAAAAAGAPGFVPHTAYAGPDFVPCAGPPLRSFWDGDAKTSTPPRADLHADGVRVRVHDSESILTLSPEGYVGAPSATGDYDFTPSPDLYEQPTSPYEESGAKFAARALAELHIRFPDQFPLKPEHDSSRKRSRAMSDDVQDEVRAILARGSSVMGPGDSAAPPPHRPITPIYHPLPPPRKRSRRALVAAALPAVDVATIVQQAPVQGVQAVAM